MASEPCPLLGTLDESSTPAPPVEYPSFENKCLVADERDTLLLADQASYCLSGGYRVCPRYRAAESMAKRGQVDARTAADVAGGVLASDQLRPELMGATELDEARGTRRRWAWLSAATLFISLLLCGAVFAAYSGWQQVQAYLDGREAGRVQAVAGSAQAAVPQFLILTATAPAPGADAARASASAAQAESAAQGVSAASVPGVVDASQVSQPGAQQFPAAVTPTPLPPGAQPAALPGADPNATEPPVILVDPEESLLLPAPETPPNILLEVPTRRPTPVFDLPTSTPGPPDTPAPPPTDTPVPTPMGTPVVVFEPAERLVPDGECTMISWAVQNVREVYYGNIGVDGRGQHEECVDDLIEVYKLVVILPDGSARTYTTTVTMLQPTATPEPTATFTLEPVFTPTWTPLPPTATPTPSVNRGVVVNVNGSTERSCARGASCEVGLLITNTGDEIDNLLASITESGPWSAMLCRQDGVCARTDLAMTDVGPGNAAYVNLRVEVPADAEGVQRFGVQATSAGSGGSVTSAETLITITPE